MAALPVPVLLLGACLLLAGVPFEAAARDVAEPLTDNSETAPAEQTYSEIFLSEPEAKALLSRGKRDSDDEEEDRSPRSGTLAGNNGTSDREDDENEEGAGRRGGRRQTGRRGANAGTRRAGRRRTAGTRRAGSRGREEDENAESRPAGVHHHQTGRQVVNPRRPIRRRLRTGRRVTGASTRRPGRQAGRTREENKNAEETRPTRASHRQTGRRVAHAGTLQSGRWVAYAGPGRNRSRTRGRRRKAGWGRRGRTYRNQQRSDGGRRRSSFVESVLEMVNERSQGASQRARSRSWQRRRQPGRPTVASPRETTSGGPIRAPESTTSTQTVVRCAIPPPIFNGTMSYHGDTSQLPDAGLAVGAVLHFQCDPDFRLVGSETIRCLGSLERGGWSGVPPACHYIEPSSAPEANITAT